MAELRHEGGALATDLAPLEPPIATDFFIAPTTYYVPKEFVTKNSNTSRCILQFIRHSYSTNLVHILIKTNTNRHSSLPLLLDGNLSITRLVCSLFCICTRIIRALRTPKVPCGCHLEEHGVCHSMRLALAWFD